MAKLVFSSIGSSDLFSSHAKKNGINCMDTMGENSIPLINMHNNDLCAGERKFTDGTVTGFPVSVQVFNPSEVKVTARTAVDENGGIRVFPDEFVYDALFNTDASDDTEFIVIALPFAGSINEVHVTNDTGENIPDLTWFKCIATKTEKFSVNVESGRDGNTTEWTFDRIAYLVFVSTRKLDMKVLNITVNTSMASKMDDGKFNVKRRGFKYVVPINCDAVDFASIKVIYYGKSVEDTKPISLSIKDFGNPFEVNPYPQRNPADRKNNPRNSGYSKDKKFDANKRQFTQSKPKTYSKPNSEFYADRENGHMGKPTRRRNDKNKNRRYD